jgi:hypothetical protein
MHKGIRRVMGPAQDRPVAHLHAPAGHERHEIAIARATGERLTSAAVGRVITLALRTLCHAAGPRLKVLIKRVVAGRVVD